MNFYNTVLSINFKFDCFSGIVELVKKLGNLPFEREDEEVNTYFIFLSALPKTPGPKVTNLPLPPPLFTSPEPSPPALHIVTSFCFSTCLTFFFFLHVVDRQ